jgi:hypothetical protein
VLPACSDSSDQAAGESTVAAFNDPGTSPWEPVAPDALIDECGLDPDILAAIDQTAPYSYAIVRYGKLCHEFYPPDMPGQFEIAQNWSVTKTLGATIVGRAAYMSADLPKPLRDSDRMDEWVDNISFNQDAQVGHVLSMIGFNESLAFGERYWEYDVVGAREINRLSDVVEEVIAQDAVRFNDATTTGEFAQAELFDKLGMSTSVWGGDNFGFSWQSNLRDMARLGVLLVHGGVWDQQQLIDAEWVYRMTHPAFEDTNLSYGYLTWMTSTPSALPDIDPNMGVPPGQCSPPSIWREFPHTLSESIDCNYDDPQACVQTYDVGVFSALGLGGQIIEGHRALDLVLVARDSAGANPRLWDMIRPALVEHDPGYAGDDAAFCEAYRAADYAPDLITQP